MKKSNTKDIIQLLENRVENIGNIITELKEEERNGNPVLTDEIAAKLKGLIRDTILDDILSDNTDKLIKNILTSIQREVTISKILNEKADDEFINELTNKYITLIGKSLEKYN